MFLAQHGVLGIDWDVDLQRVGFKDREHTLDKQAQLFASIGQRDKLVFVYRQAKKALSIFDFTEAAMRNSNDADLFLRWPNGTVFDEPLVVLPPNEVMQQYLYDYRNPLARQLAFELLTSDVVIGSKHIAGIFIDGIETDTLFSGGVHPNISKQDTRAIIDGQHIVLTNVTQTLFDAQYLVWQSFVERNLPDQNDGTTNCVMMLEDLIQFCNSTPAAVPGLYSNHCVGPWSKCPDIEAQLAMFLIVRGEYSLFFGPDEPPFYAPLNYDYGAPLDLSRRSNATAFTRSYTNVDVSFDCATWNMIVE